MERDSFIFYRSFYEALDPLSDADKGAFVNAICRFSLYGEEPSNLSPVLKAMFGLVRPQIEANYRKYVNGKNGGRPPKENQTETKTKPSQNQTVTLGYPDRKPNDNVNADVNANANPNENGYVAHSGNIFTDPLAWEEARRCGMTGSRRNPVLPPKAPLPDKPKDGSGEQALSMLLGGAK